MDPLETRVQAVLRGVPVARVAVVARLAGGRDILAVNPGSVFHAASTMKVPVLVELFRRYAAGTLAPDDQLPVRLLFQSLADGSTYVLDAADDTELGLYGRVGELVSLQELARLMTTVSSNVATNLLVDLLSAEAISATAADLGAPTVRVLRGVEDGPAHVAGLDSTVTAAGLATLLEQLALGRVVSPAASASMLEILAAQAFNHGIPAGLPPGTRVAHKTGSIPGLFHDAAVILSGHAAPWVLVVLTQGLEEHRAAPALVASIAALIAAEIGAETAAAG